MTKNLDIALGAIFFAVSLSGCAETREARLADELASTWLQPENKEPLIVCGVEIPWKDDADQAQGTAALKEKATDTAKILLRESLRKVRLSAGITIGRLMTQGGTALALADVLVEIAQDALPPSMQRRQCDEFDVAAVREKIAEVQSFTDEADLLSHFGDTHDLTDAANFRYFTLRVVHFQEWAEAIKNESRPEEIAAFHRKQAAATLKSCLRDPRVADDCDFWIDNDRRKREDGPLLDHDVVMIQREREKKKLEAEVARYGR